MTGMPWGRTRHGAMTRVYSVARMERSVIRDSFVGVARIALRSIRATKMHVGLFDN